MTGTRSACSFCFFQARRGGPTRVRPTIQIQVGSQYEFSSQALWKPLLDGMAAEKVSEELEAYPKLVVAMDVMTQSAIAIMTPHLPHEGSAPSKGKAPSRRAKKQTEKSSRENPKEKAR